MAGRAAVGEAALNGMLRRVAPPSRLPDKDWRGASVSLIREFVAFAERSCGCQAPANRAFLRRAVFHVGQGFELAPFVTEQLGGDASSLEAIARMDCPVTLPDRTMLQVKVPESAPKKIVFASKALRKHLSMTETQTCRGCLKRQRCRFFKVPAEAGETASVKHVTRVLFGMAQYARAHLQRGEVFPFYFTEEQLAGAKTLMAAVDALIAEVQVPLLHEIDVADPEEARQIHRVLDRRKLMKQQQYREERVLALPQWIRDTLRPVPGPGMNRRQRLLLEQGGGSEEGSDSGRSGEPARQALSGLGEDSADWVEEGATPGEPAGPLILDPVPMSPRAGGTPVLGAAAAEPPVVVVGASDRPAAPPRFEHVAPRWEEKKVTQFNSVLGRHTSNVRVRANRLRGGSETRVDLDAVEGADDDFWSDATNAASDMAALRGGYTVVDMLSGDGVPTEVLRYVSVSPRALDGVQEYRVSAASKTVDASVLEELWRRKEAGQEELPFLTPVPFDTGPRKSGGTMPPQRLPQSLLLQSPEPIVPPPARDVQAQRRGGAHASEEGPVVELDGPESAAVSDDVLRADEEFLAQVLQAGARDLRAEASWLGSPAGRASKPEGARSDETSTPEEAEDRRFASWSGRRALGGQHAVSVLEPAVDLSSLSDAKRLERVGAVEVEVDVPIRQSPPLGQDEDFIQTFRRPLLSTDGGADPLGTAAPGINIQALKAAVQDSTAPGDQAVQPSPGALAQDSRFVIGGSLRFPKLPLAQAPPPAGPGRPWPEAQARPSPAATERLPPRLGRLRQARLEDLSDLLRPGGGAAAAAAAEARGRHGSPRRPGRPRPGTAPAGGGVRGGRHPPVDAAEPREQENAAIVLQKELNKRLKSSVKQRFPSGRAAARNDESVAAATSPRRGGASAAPSDVAAESSRRRPA